MKLLFCGDVVGRSGRQAINDHLPKLRHLLNPDLIIVNAENAAHGFGMTRAICEDLFDLGVGVITGGNHTWDQKEIMSWIHEEPRVLRPINYPPGTPGYGHCFYPLPSGKQVLVINAMGRLFMDPLDDPFYMINELLNEYPMGRDNIAATVIDFHAETTSEKNSIACYVDGFATLVVGTHTHIPTADARILPGGTAYQTDAGMCGDYDSVIGMKKAAPIERFTTKISRERLSPSEGEGTLLGVYVECDESTGLATRIESVCVGPHLQNHIPTVD